ncbi:MAG: FecR family protein [Planctomycetota bacterium]
MSRLVELMLRWQEGNSSAEEVQELKALLQTDAGQKAVVEDLMLTAAMCAALATEKTGETARAVASQKSTGPNPRIRATGARRTQRPRSAVRPWFIPLAVALLIVVFFTTTTYTASSLRPGQLTAFTGDVRIVPLGGQSRPAELERLNVGWEIQVPAGTATATVLYRDGSTLILGPDTRLVLGGDNINKLVDLRQGSLTADIAKQTGRPMRLTTPRAEAVVVGTRFTLSADADSTRLAVSEGLVELVRAHDRVSVAAGEHALAGGEQAAPIARRAPIGPSPAELLAREGRVTINFGPAGWALPPDTLNDAGEEFASTRGYGWLGSLVGAEQTGPAAHCDAVTHIPLPLRAGRRPNQVQSETPALRSTHVGAGWRNHPETWQVALPNGSYRLDIVCGDPRRTQGPHRLLVNGQLVIDGAMTIGKINRLQHPNVPPFIELTDLPVTVSNGLLVLTVGGQPLDKSVQVNTDTTLCYVVISR